MSCSPGRELEVLLRSLDDQADHQLHEEVGMTAAAQLARHEVELFQSSQYSG